MYHKIRITVVSLVAMTICLLSSSATLSYFTDTDGTTNNFTIGNASTSLALYSDATGEQAFVPSSDPLTDKTNIPLYLEATNNGNIPVYQRFRIVIPIALANVVTLNLPAGNDCKVETVDNNICSDDDYTIKYNASVEVENKPTYAEYYVTYNHILPVDGKTSRWPLTGVHIDGLSGTNKELFTCVNNDSNNCVFGISAYSDAIQTSGFPNAIEAFEELGEVY